MATSSIEVADHPPFTAEDVDHVALGYLWGRHAPWWAILIKGALIYLLHKREIEETLSLVPQVLSHLQEIKRRNPALHAQIIATTRAELLRQIPRSVKPEDPAFLLGRLLRAHEAGAKAPALTWVGLQVVLLVLVLHLPGALALALARATEEHAVPLLREEAAQFLSGLSPEDRAAVVAQLRGLRDASTKLEPELVRFARLWGTRLGAMQQAAPGPAKAGT